MREVLVPSLMGIFMISSFSFHYYKVLSLQEKSLKAINGDILPRNESKVDLLIASRDVNEFFRLLQYTAVSLLSAIFVAFLAKKLHESREPAAIILNDQMKKTFLAAKADRDWHAYAYIVALIGTTCIGMFQKAIYDVLKSFFLSKLLQPR